MNDMGKARSRTKDGKKFCPACGKWLPIADFPAGSGQCGDDRKALQNLKKAAMAQDQMEWWEETIRDPTKLKRTTRTGCPRLARRGRSSASSSTRRSAGRSQPSSWTASWR